MYDLEGIAEANVGFGVVPPGTAAGRDFSSIATEIPIFDSERCAGCMNCVTECPDTAILAKAIPVSRLGQQWASNGNSLRKHWARTNKFHDHPAKQGKEAALFGIFVDATKCKGCGECVEVCDALGYHALRMERRSPDNVSEAKSALAFFQKVGPTPREYISEKALVDFMLAESEALLYTGGAGSCTGCGEATAIRMMLAATGFTYGAEHIGIVASTGCNSVFGSTWPYNPYRVAWTSSLFENAPAVAAGIRKRWEQERRDANRLWVIGGDGAMYDIGFGSLSRLLASGLDVKVLVLDTQVYSNTGGQASTATFQAQDARMSAFGRKQAGKSEARKELALLALMHGDVYVAQTSCAYPNHFYRAVMQANSFPGPALVNVYATCQPEHGVADCSSTNQARRAVESRAFPLFSYDPRKGESIRQRLDLVGNPASRADWYTPPGSSEPFTFVDFARGQGRFARHFDPAGKPSPALQAATEERLRAWHRLQELAGVR